MQQTWQFIVSKPIFFVHFQASETNKTLMELQTKLKFYERKMKDLERENDQMQNTVQNLEGELEEVQDNFREDEDDEYRQG